MSWAASLLPERFTMFNVLKDIRSGALPVSDIPGYLAWLVGKSFWFWFAIVGVGIAVWLIQ